MQTLQLGAPQGGGRRASWICLLVGPQHVPVAQRTNTRIPRHEQGEDKPASPAISGASCPARTVITSASLSSSEYDKLLDIHEGRIHANVTVARETNLKDENLIAEQLSRVIGKTVIPHMTVNPAILGGVVVKIGDTVMDGSVRRRLSRLKSQILAH